MNQKLALQLKKREEEEKRKKQQEAEAAHPACLIRLSVGVRGSPPSMRFNEDGRDNQMGRERASRKAK